jgi:indole-3-glycerol phosphate synthase
VQESPNWSPPTGPLGRLTRAARERAEQLLPRLREMRASGLNQPRPPSLARALTTGPSIAIIAEIKRRSPSRGVLREHLNAAERATVYEAAGAAALSVLTEPSEFGGSPSDLSSVRSAVELPLLKKDFHVEPAQVWEARMLGASAMLFIVRALGPGLLEQLVDEAIGAGLEALVEVRSEHELERALATPARLIGVNNRDLETLVIDHAVCDRLIPLVPPDRVAISESGVTGRDDVARAGRGGSDAVLVGSVLSSANDPSATLETLLGVPRGRRGD